MGWPADVPASAHLFVASATDLTDTLDIAGEDAHHLARVLRLRPGEPVTVADGSGTWRPYRLAQTGDMMTPPAPAGPGGPARRPPGGGRRRPTPTLGPRPGAEGVRLDATGGLDREPVVEPGLAVAFALTKGEKPDFTVQKLTELGVDRILPVLAERSVARPDPAQGRSALERWRRIAREAARQCRRATLPVVEELGTLADLAGHLGLVVAERGGARPEALTAPPGGELLVVVGPEGGLAAAEVEKLGPWARLDLGPHILRAETAALAAAAVLGPGRRVSMSRRNAPGGSGGPSGM